MSKILTHQKLKAMMVAHAKETLQFLVQEGMNFSVLCEVNKIKFVPPLPDYIFEDFAEMTIFIMAGYTFESIELCNETLDFEAGFGSENIGSFVSIPYDAIVQILFQDDDLLQEIPLFTNVTQPKLYRIPEEEIQKLYETEKKGLEQSSLALSSNPENQRFFKK